VRKFDKNHREITACDKMVAVKTTKDVTPPFFVSIRRVRQLRNQIRNEAMQLMGSRPDSNV